MALAGHTHNRQSTYYGKKMIRDRICITLRQDLAREVGDLVEKNVFRNISEAVEFLLMACLRGDEVNQMMESRQKIWSNVKLWTKFVTSIDPSTLPTGKETKKNA